MDNSLLNFRQHCEFYHSPGMFPVVLLLALHFKDDCPEIGGRFLYGPFLIEGVADDVCYVGCLFHFTSFFGIPTVYRLGIMPQATLCCPGIDLRY